MMKNNINKEQETPAKKTLEQAIAKYTTPLKIKRGIKLDNCGDLGLNVVKYRGKEVSKKCLESVNIQVTQRKYYNES